MIYEVVNPSDPVTIDADDQKVAIAATLLLGKGAYGLMDRAGEIVVPVMLLGGGENFVAEAFGGSDALGAFMDDRRAEIAACLRTSMVCTAGERAALTAAFGLDAGPMDRWNDAKRSSVNDLCGLAREMASQVEAGRAW